MRSSFYFIDWDKVGTKFNGKDLADIGILPLDEDGYYEDEPFPNDWITFYEKCKSFATDWSTLLDMIHISYELYEMITEQNVRDNFKFVCDYSFDHFSAEGNFFPDITPLHLPSITPHYLIGPIQIKTVLDIWEKYDFMKIIRDLLEKHPFPESQYGMIGGFLRYEDMFIFWIKLFYDAKKENKGILVYF